MRSAITTCLLLAALGSVAVRAAQSSGDSASPTASQSVATQSAASQSPASQSEAASPYTVKDGDKVDQKTLDGWKTWRALACERCHGAEQEGLVGPPLVESMKRLTKDEFHTVLMEGRAEKGMPPFKASDMVNKNWEGLYAYLKGRSDGQIQPGRLTPIE